MGIGSKRFSKKNLWKFFNIYMEVIFHKSLCPKIVGSDFKIFLLLQKLAKKKSMTEMTEIAFEGSFVDIDQKEIGLRNKIGCGSTDTTILRHNFFYLLSVFDEI